MKSLRVFAAILLVGASSCASNKPAPDETETAEISHQPPQDSEVAMPSGPPVVRPADTADAADTAKPGDSELDPSEAPPEEEQFTVTKAELESFMDRGPSHILTVVTVEPVHRDDGFQGYQIVDVKRGARQFMTPQMRVGDVVTHVNGVRLKRPEDYMQAWRSLDKVTTIRVDFLRQSKPMNAVWVVK